MSAKKAMISFKEKSKKAISEIKDVQQFKEADKMVDFVFETGKMLFTNDLDRIPPSKLLKYGGKLTGIYAYLGNMASRARAERDIYANKLEEVKGDLILEYVGAEYKVTEARARANLEVAEINDLLTGKEQDKNNYEHILYATDKMVSFIQSAIKVKEGERYRGKMEDN